MHKPYYAQRMHIVSTLDALLYQLVALSFFMSPSIWTLVFRLLAQQQSTRRRDVDPARSLRFFFILIFVANIFGTWAHATSGPVQGRGVVLDFITPYTPSKFQLVTLDISILILQMLLATLVFEIHVVEHTDEDTLLPAPVASMDKTPPYIIDLTFSHILKRLKESASPVTATPARESVLPLPNTTPWSLPMTLIRARAQRREAQEALRAATPSRTVPGSLDARHVDE